MADQGPAGPAEAGGLSDCIAARAVFSTLPGVKHVVLTCTLPKLHGGPHHDPVQGHWEDEL